MTSLISLPGPEDLTRAPRGAPMGGQGAPPRVAPRESDPQSPPSNQDANFGVPKILKSFFLFRWSLSALNANVFRREEKF